METLCMFWWQSSASNVLNWKELYFHCTIYIYQIGQNIIYSLDEIISNKNTLPPPGFSPVLSRKVRSTCVLENLLLCWNHLTSLLRVFRYICECDETFQESSGEKAVLLLHKEVQRGTEESAGPADGLRHHKTWVEAIASS